MLARHQHTQEMNNQLIIRLQSLINMKIILTQTLKHQYILQKEAASDDEIMPQNIYPSKFYTKFQTARDGICILEIKNKTHLYFENRWSLNYSVVNYLWIVKQNQLIDHIDNDVQNSSIITLNHIQISLVAYYVVKNKKVKPIYDDIFM